MLLSGISDLEKWILSDLAIQQIGLNNKGRGWDQAHITIKYVITQAPPSLLPEINQTNTIWVLLTKLSQMGLLRPIDQHASDTSRFVITTEGIGMFRKHLLPVKIVKEKKSYNSIIDQVEGSPTIKKDLKKLGDKLRDKLEDEAADEFIRFALKTGSATILYYLHLLAH